MRKPPLVGERRFSYKELDTESGNHQYAKYAVYIVRAGSLCISLAVGVIPAHTSCGALEIVHHPHFHLVSVHNDVHGIDVLVGMGFNQLVDIHMDNFVRYVFSFDIDLHTIISFVYSNSCFISYKYIVAENRPEFQLQVHHFHISLLTVNSFWNKKYFTL